MKNKGAKQKLKRKGAASAFGCDLTEYLESSGQDGNVPSPFFFFNFFLFEGEVDSPGVC